MRLRYWAIVLVAGALPAGALFAQSTAAPDPRSQDALSWLGRMTRSAVETTFSGIYIHQNGPRMETSRVIHVTDDSGEQEKLETLDGPPREIIRKNDDLTCYNPDAKIKKVERKRVHKFFPALLTNVSDVTENYAAKLGGMDRVAGFDCQVVILDPKDSFRFGHRFCAELTSGLMLRATMVSDNRDVVEQFVFTQLAIGTQVNRDLVKPTWGDSKGNWHTDKSAVQDGADSGWYVKSPPPGFKKILEVKRKMSSKPEPVIQQIYSDGLASVSVFIESAPQGDKSQAGLIQEGHYNVYVRPLPDQHFSVKVLGEVPRASLQQFGNSLASRSR